MDKEGQVLVQSNTQGDDYPCAGLSADQPDNQRLPGATRSMNICDWTGQEEGEVDGLSDKNGVICAAQEVQQPPQATVPHTPTVVLQGLGSAHPANSVLQGQAFPGQALLRWQTDSCW